MSLCDRLIGGAVDGLMLAIDTIASFWQTPREVEWAKAAAASGEPCECGHRIHDSNVCPVGECLCLGWFPERFHLYDAADGLAECEAEINVAEGDDDDDTPRCYFCGEPTENIAGTDYDTGEYVCEGCADPETSATTPVAESGPAEGKPPEPSAGVDEMHLELCNCGCGQQVYRRGPPSPSAEVEPPASAPSAESATPEFDWVTTAIPVIAGVLAEHKFLPIMGRCECPSLPRVADWQRWSEHVSPIIAIAIQSDLLSTIYEDTTFAINAFSGDRPRPLTDFPKHQNPRM